MAIFDCKGCGHNAKVRDDLAGKQVKCPKCGLIGQVPAARPSAQSPTATTPDVGDDIIKFRCSCGQTISAKVAACGKKIRCPKCGLIGKVASSPQSFADDFGSSGDTIKFRCSFCQEIITAKKGFAGKRYRCAGCKNVVPVPTSDFADPPHGESQNFLVGLAEHERTAPGMGKRRQLRPPLSLPQEHALPARPMPCEVENSSDTGGSGIDDASMEWFYIHDGEHYGPVTATVVKKKIGEGELSRSAQVWKSGMEAWVPLSAVLEFQVRGMPSPPSLQTPPSAPPRSQSGVSGVPCPYCHENIRKDALRCTHCGGQLLYCARCKQNVGLRTKPHFVGLLRGGTRDQKVCMNCGKVLEGSRW